VLAQHPYHADARHLLGLIALQRGDQEQAARLVADAVRLTPAAANMHANLGLIYFATNRFAEAEAELTEAVHLHPAHAVALNNLGSTLNALGRNDEAIECYRRAIAVPPDFRPRARPASPRRAPPGTSTAAEGVSADGPTTVCRDFEQALWKMATGPV
jgi:tetratricopeptide (TPR) repeat protein